MPNGIQGMASIAINEGRASRIAHYTHYSSHLSQPGDKGYIPPTPRGIHHMAESWRKLAEGVAKRKKMAKTGKMTHGAGRVYLPKGKAPMDVTGAPYSTPATRRESRKHLGEVSANWRAFKPETKEQINKKLKKSGTGGSKLTPRYAKRA